MELQYYYTNYSPLKKVILDELEHNDVVYDEFGRCKKKLIIKDHSYFIDICDSVLMDGELMTNLTKLQLELFWKLSKTKLKKLRVAK